MQVGTGLEGGRSFWEVLWAQRAHEAWAYPFPQASPQMGVKGGPLGKTLEQGLQSVRERDVTSRKFPGQRPKGRRNQRISCFKAECRPTLKPQMRPKRGLREAPLERV